MKTPPVRRLLGPWLSAIGCLLLSTPARALDFQLHTAVVEEDGYRRDQAYFQNDAATVVYVTLPGGWSRAGSPASLTLHPPNVATSEARLDLSPAPALPRDFKDPASLEMFRKRALASVPQGATAPRVSEEHEMPLPFFNWRDYEFVVSYDFFGQAFRRSILFVDLDGKQQIVATITASPENFDPVRATTLALLRSWQVLPSAGK